LNVVASSARTASCSSAFAAARATTRPPTGLQPAGIAFNDELWAVSIL
jgi:hypothetical protein